MRPIISEIGNTKPATSTYRHFSTALSVFTRDLIEQWSAEHPEEGVLGLAAIIESQALRQRQRDPVWANTGLNLVAFTSKGKQLRVAWFRHARVPVG